MNHVPRRDEIDIIVDDILANPARAEELKGRLRHRLPRDIRGEDRGAVGHVAHRRALADIDDLWDNVPV
ncbi:MAG: hypothetical protein CVT84_14965 [Alphaproteobacteria bacterium HGW-Alphaproteobacteria-6]|jgi:hypothetical protein|nr:MAG: hypothetical protein CVT84_14965 [Alphaproteobacteria bacterium HGW-Alphaproteobacteria-6]